jgi:hypothetical protein
VAASFFFSACFSDRVVQIHATDFVNYGYDPLSHTVYTGSDATYHYFAWSHGKSGGRWKILKSEMPFDHELPVSSRHSFLERDVQGHWQPHVVQ